MGKNSSVNLDITNNADGFDISGGTSKRKLTISTSNINLIGGGAYNHTLPAVTDTLVSRTSSDVLTNKTLSTGTAVGATISPLVTNIYDLGTTFARYKEMFAVDLTVGSISYPNVINTAASSGSCAINQSSSTCDLEIGTSSATFDPRGVLVNQFNTGTDAGLITIRKARGTGTTTVANADGIGTIRFQAYGTAMSTRAQINCTVSGTVSSNIVPGQLSFSTMNTSGALGVRAIISPAGNFTLGSTEGTGAADLFLNKVKKSSATQSGSSWAHELNLSATNLELHSTGNIDLFLDIDNNATSLFRIYAGTGTYQSGTLRFSVDENGNIAHTAASTTVNAYALTANSLTTGSGFVITSSSTNTSSRNLISMTNSSALATGVKCLNISQASSGEAINISQTIAGTAMTITCSDNSATAMYGIKLNVANAGAGQEYAFRFDGSEIDNTAVGGTQDKKIKVSVAGTDYFIPLHTA